MVLLPGCLPGWPMTITCSLHTCAEETKQKWRKVGGLRVSTGSSPLHFTSLHTYTLYTIHTRMIACKPLFRVDRAWKFTNACVIKYNPRRLEYFQGHCSYYGLNYNRKMGGGKDTQSARDRNKKQKTVYPVWRPVCSQASSHEEFLNVKVAPVDGSQVQEVNSSRPNHVSIVRDVNREAEAVNELTGSIFIPKVSQSNVNDVILGGCSTPSPGKNTLSVEVGASLVRFIRGKGGSTQKEIEEEMGVKLILPSSKREECISGYLVIEGMSVESVNRASEKIQAIIDEAVKSPYLDYSHFVSLPLAIHPELVDKLFNFQSSILGLSGATAIENLESDSNENTSDDEDKDQRKGCDVALELKVEDDKERARGDIDNIRVMNCPPKASKSPSFSELGIEKSIFIKPKTFHLTVLMLKLWNKDRVDAATEVLRSVSSKVMDALDGRPISVRLKGLNCMRGSLAKARVLYAPVEEIGSENRLLRACQVMIDAYVEAGLVLEKDAKENLKLHATVMNARHRKRNKRTRKLDFFDARGIMKQYGSEQWGDYLIREAHLSQRFVFDENGYYRCCASIPFPKIMQVD